ncbi:hypothetical protein ACFL1S_00070 [Pseudomonadota bacterium]
MVLTAVCCSYVYLTWHSEFVDLLSDSAIYLLMASSLDSGQQISESVRHVVLSDYHFPPIFPFVLWIFGGGAAYPFASHFINTSLLVTSLVFFFVWLRIQGVELTLALVLSVLVASLPVTIYFANFIVSEYLFMSFAFMALIALERSDSTQRRIYWAALFIGFAISTRFIGVALLPALAFFTFRTRPRHFVAVLAVAVCLPLLWSLYKTSFGSSNYVSSFFLSHKSDFFTSVLVYAWVNLQVLGLSWIKSFDHYISDYSTLPAIVLGLMALAGWVHRIARGRTDSIYVFFYFLILLPWPHPDHIHRFLLPVLPIMLFYTTVSARLVADRLESPSGRALIVYGILAISFAVTLPTNVLLIKRLATSLPEHLEDFGRSQFWLFARDPKDARQRMDFMHSLNRSMTLADFVPINACLWSIDPARQMLTSRRASYATPLPELDDASFDRATERCRYFFVMSAIPAPNHSNITAFYPAERIVRTSRVIKQFEHEKFGVVSALLKREVD